MRLPRSLAVSLCVGLGWLSVAEAFASVGQRFPSELRVYADPTTGVPVRVLTDSAEFSDAKPYQTHTTWTSDGRWIVFRSNRGGDGSQAFVVNETTGDIIQLTEGPGTGTGSLNLSRKTMTLYFMRGGEGGRREEAPPGPRLPRQLIASDIGAIIADSLAGKPKPAAAYERVVATLPADLRDAGGFALDADETKAYWGVAPALSAEEVALREKELRTARTPAERAEIDRRNTEGTETREEARQRFALAGRGPGGIRSIDLRTGAVTTVIDVPFRMGHVQTNPWVPGEIVYCHETTGDGPQRMWAVNADGTNNRPLYRETPDEWITHETVSGRDEVMFLIIGHLPYLREKPTGIAVVNLRTQQMKLLGQVEEDMGSGRQGGYWHCNGSPDGRWAVGDTFKGNIWLIDRTTGQQRLLTTDHRMRPDHTHPIFSPDSRRVAIQSGRFSDGKRLALVSIEVPAAWTAAP